MAGYNKCGVETGESVAYMKVACFLDHSISMSYGETIHLADGKNSAQWNVSQGFVSL